MARKKSSKNSSSTKSNGLRGETTLEMPPMPGRRTSLEETLQERIADSLRRARDEEEYRAGTLKSLSEYCRKEKARIIGRDRRKLDAYRAEERKSRNKFGVWYPQQRLARKAELIRYAQEMGIDTDELFRLNAYVRTRANLLMDPPGKVNYFPYQPQPEGESFDQNCTSRQPPTGVGTFATDFQQVTGSGQVLESRSYFDPPAAQSGGAVRVRNWDADDSDIGVAYQENGFTTCYTTKNKPSLLKITATFEAVEGHITLSTYDEFGWSDCSIRIDSFARLAVYQTEPGDLDYLSHSLAGWRYQGDGEDPHDLPDPGWGSNLKNFPGPGTQVTVSDIFPYVVPANTMVGVYVGTRQEVNFWVNDVSVDGRIGGKWRVANFEVCQM